MQLLLLLLLLLQSSATGLAPGRRRLVQRHLSKKGPMDKEAFFVECVCDKKLPLPVRKLLLALKCEKDAAVVEKDLAAVKLTNEKDLAMVRLTREKNAMAAAKDLAVVRLTREKNAVAAAKDLAMIEKDFDMQQLELAINNLMFPTSVLNPRALLENVEDKFMPPEYTKLPRQEKWENFLHGTDRDEYAKAVCDCLKNIPDWDNEKKIAAHLSNIHTLASSPLPMCTGASILANRKQLFRISGPLFTQTLRAIHCIGRIYGFPS